MLFAILPLPRFYLTLFYFLHFFLFVFIKINIKEFYEIFLQNYQI
jgi:hypothetical protein